MNKNFVSYKIASKLKNLDFNEPCFKFFNHQNELELFSSDILDDNKINSLLDSIDDYSYDDDEISYELCTAPLWQQVMGWLRDIHNIHIHICVPNKMKWLVQLHTLNGEWIFSEENDSEWYFDTYEDAREQSILKALELVSVVS